MSKQKTRIENKKTKTTTTKTAKSKPGILGSSQRCQRWRGTSMCHGCQRILCRWSGSCRRRLDGTSRSTCFRQRGTRYTSDSPCTVCRRQRRCLRQRRRWHQKQQWQPLRGQPRLQNGSQTCPVCVSEATKTSQGRREGGAGRWGMG